MYRNVLSKILYLNLQNCLILYRNFKNADITYPNFKIVDITYRNYGLPGPFYWNTVIHKKLLNIYFQATKQVLHIVMKYYYKYMHKKSDLWYVLRYVWGLDIILM